MAELITFINSEYITSLESRKTAGGEINKEETKMYITGERGT